MFFLNQQFITWSMRADCDSYIITTYKRSRHTWRRKRKEKKEKREKYLKEKEKRKRKGKQSLKVSIFNNKNVMNLFLRVGNKNNSYIRETQENSIENSFTN